MQEDEVKPEEIESTNEETPEQPSEASPEEPETPAEPEDQPEEQSEEVVEEKPPSRRESLRIQQLLEKNKQLSQQVEQTTGLDFQKDIEADPEVLKRITDEVEARGEAKYNEGLSQALWRNRLDIDAPRIEAKYPQLDPKSPDFHPAVADALNKAYLSATGFDSTTGKAQNPNLRYADYIEAQFELAEEVAGNKVQETSQNIAKQAAQTGLRPDGSQAKRLNLNKAPGEMTDEELAAAIAQAGISTGKPRK